MNRHPTREEIWARAEGIKIILDINLPPLTLKPIDIVGHKWIASKDVYEAIKENGGLDNTEELFKKIKENGGYEPYPFTFEQLYNALTLNFPCNDLEDK